MRIDRHAVAYLRAETPERISELEDKTRSWARGQGLILKSVLTDRSLGCSGLWSLDGLADLVEGSGDDRWAWVVIESWERAPDEALARVVEDGLCVVELGEELGLEPLPPRAPRPPKRVASPAMRKPCAPPAGASQRLLEGRRASVLKGKPPGGAPPFGYRSFGLPGSKRLEPDPEEAAIVRLIFTQYLRLGAVHAVVRHLNRKGLKPRRAQRWSKPGVHWILRNKTYTGRVRMGAVAARGLHRPIIESIVFNRAQVMLRKNRRVDPAAPGEELS